MNDRTISSRLARRLYKGKITFDEFVSEFPEDESDKDIFILFDLIEHEPAVGGLLGVSSSNYENHINNVFNLIYKLEPVPEFIDQAKTLFYTDIDKRHDKSNDTKHYVGKELVHEISGLAICKYDNVNGFYLFGCNENWESITDTFHDNIQDAKKQAEFEFKNSILTWRSK